MKLVIHIKLKPDNEQKQSLLNTIKEANTACNELSEYAFENKVFNQFKLHRAKYHAIKSSFNLSAQMVVRCISKCADSYKIDKKKQRVFKELGAITYDVRILSYNIEKRIASIWSVDGRLKIPFIPYPEKYLPYIKGEADLIYKKGKFYLFQTCEVPEEDIKDVEEWLGVDMGLVEIATLNNGKKFSSKSLNDYREKRQKIRNSVDRSKTKRYWWTYDLSLVMKFKSLIEADKVASNYKFNDPTVVTLSEAFNIRNQITETYEKNKRHFDYTKEDYDPGDSEYWGQKDF